MNKMMKKQILPAIILVLAIAGCSTSSGLTPEDDSSGGPSRTAPKSGYGRILWGLWDVTINPDDGSVDAVMLRNADFTANVTQFMQPLFSAINWVSIQVQPGTNFGEGYIIVNVTLRHPFNGKNFYNGFDVRGIFMADGSYNGTYDPTVLYAGEGDTQLLNADGYTRWWNPTEFLTYNTLFGYTPGNLAPPVFPLATVNPFKYFADDLDVNEPFSQVDISKRGFFTSTPGVNTRRYEIQFKKDGGKPVFKFQYAVDASWAPPDPAYKPDYPAEAFPLEANCREAFMVDVTDAGSTAWWEDTDDYGGELVLDITVGDWQGAVNPQGPLGEVAAIWIEGPILNGAVEVLGNADIISLESYKFIAEVTLDNLLLTQAGTEELFGTVISAAPNSYEPQTPGGSNFDYPIAPLAAFFKCTVEIKGGGGLPIWPVAQGNRGHTGYVGLYGPDEIHDAPTWTHLWQPHPYGNPLSVFLSETVAFLSNTGDGGPLPCGAVDLVTKTTKWNQQFHYDMQNWLNLKAISEDGEIAFTCESKYNTIYGLDTEDGSEVWQIPGEMRADDYPTIDLDGNFIIPIKDIGYRSVDAHTGAINWTTTGGSGYYSVPAVGANGVIYATQGGQWDRILVALNPADGSINWQTGSLGQGAGNGVTVHPNGDIILHTMEGLHCFRDLGDDYTVVWQQPYPCPFFSSVGVGPSGDIYSLDYEGVFRRLDPATGETVASSTGWGPGNSFRPAIGADGLVYSRSYLYDENEAYMTCWNADCTLRWQYYAGQWLMGDGHMAAPAIAQDGALISSYRTLGLCVWKDSS